MGDLEDFQNKINAGLMDDDFGVSDEDLKMLKVERELLGGLSPQNQAHRILQEASPMAAMQLVKLAMHSSSDSVRLSASKEILNRTGVVEGAGKNNDGKEPWEDLFEKAVSDIESFANQRAQEILDQHDTGEDGSSDSRKRGKE